MPLLCVMAVLLFASNGVIVLTQPNPFKVSNNGVAYSWEPSSAVRNVSGGTWTTAWAEMSLTKDSFASWWNNGWQTQSILRNGNIHFGDINLAWDDSQSHFIFAAVEVLNGTQPSV